MPDRTILVLGCGMAGVAAARDLRRLLPNERVVAIDGAPRASYPPSYGAMVVGEVKGRAIQRPLTRIARKGIEFINGAVHQIDVGGRLVRAAGRELRYDYLVVALGADMAPDSIAGLAETAQTFYTFDGAERLAAALRYFAGGRVLITVASGPTKWPPAPYELAMLLEHEFHLKKMRQKVEMTIAAPEAAPLQGLGAEVSEMIAGQLAHKGIAFAGGAMLTRVDQARHVAEFEGGDQRPFDLLIAVPPHRAPGVAVEAGLTDESGWIPVDVATLQTPHENVFAAGDVAFLRSTAGRAAMSGTLASKEAEMVARQIASRITGRPAPGLLNGKGRWFIEVGAGAAIMVSGDFLREPDRVRVAQPSIAWHWAKTATERYWLNRSW